MGLAEQIKVGDWRSVRSVIAKLNTKLGPASIPTFAGLAFTGLTASRLIATDANKALESSDLASWVTQTANQVLVADDGDGTITLSTPQDIHTGASPTFAGLTMTGTIDASTGKIRIRDDAASKPSTESDGYLSVYEDGATRRLYTFVGGQRYYINLTADVDIVVGNPFGAWLFWFTYAA